MGQPLHSSTTTSTGTSGKPIRFFANFNFPQWQQKFGQDQHSIVADPLFVAPEKDDFRLKENSPALKLGFKPFDMSKAGRTAPPRADRGAAAGAQGVRVSNIAERPTSWFTALAGTHGDGGWPMVVR